MELNQQSSKKQISLYPSNSAKFNSCISWNLLEMELVLILFWKQTERAKPRVFSFMNGLLVMKDCRINRSPRLTSFSASCLSATHSIKTFQINKIYRMLDVTLRELFKNSNIRKFLQRVKRTMCTYSKYGIPTICSLSTTLFVDTLIRM